MTAIVAAGGAAAAGNLRFSLTSRILMVFNGVGGAGVGLRIGRDGKVYKAENSLGTELTFAQVPENEQWVLPRHALVGDGYTLDAEVTSGGLTGGTAGTGLTLDIDREYSVIQTTLGTSFAGLTLTIKRAGQTVATATYTLQASVVV